MDSGAFEFEHGGLGNCGALVGTGVAASCELHLYVLQGREDRTCILPVTEVSDSTFVRHVPCDICVSQDNAALYSDGHIYCHVCGNYIGPDGEVVTKGVKPTVNPELIPFSDLNIRELPDRRLWNETAQLFRYGTDGVGRQVATYYDNQGRAVAQKTRTAKKEFSTLGDLKTALPYGANLWPRSGKMIVVTEGEIDAMSVSQAQGNKWPVVSIASGAGDQIVKYMAKHRDYFKNFEVVVLMFDMDEVGQQAAHKAAQALQLPYGQIKIATLPLKDANDMLKAAREDELVNAIWRAVEYRPTGFMTVHDLRDAVLNGPVKGESWFSPELTAATFGRRPGEIYTLGAGTGIGKTSAWIQQGAHIIREYRMPVGFALLETPPVEAALRVASAYAGKPFFVPREAGNWEDSDLQRSLDALEGLAFFYDPRTSVDWDSVSAMIRYWATGEGVKDVVIDHLSAFSASEEDDRKVLDKIMYEMSRLAQELGIRIYLISHLRRPGNNSRPHEEGGRVEIAQLRGSNAIGMWSNFIFGMERNQQADDKGEQMDVVWRVLKDRNTGRATGDTIAMRYNPATARLEEKGTTTYFQPVTNNETEATGLRY